MTELTDYETLRQNPSQFVNTVCGVEPFEYQEEFLDASVRNKVIASGRQVGKSRMCAWLALHRAVTNAHTRVLITAPSQRQSSLLFQTLYSEIDKSGMSDAKWGIERDTQTILEFDNGSSIHCLPTGRDGSNIRGHTAQLIIVDEAAFVDDVIFEDILKPMTFATGGGMVLASTPYGKSGYFYKKFDEAKHRDNWMSLQVSSYANPLIDDDDLEEYKEGKTKTQIKREVLGQFEEDSDQFFGSQAISKCINGKPERTADTAWLGADIAGSGSDRTVFYGIDANGELFLNDEVYEDMGVLEASSRIETLDNVYGFDTIYLDRTAIGEGTAERLTESPRIERKLEPIFFSLPKKAQLYQRLKAAMESGFINIPDERELRDELEAITTSSTKNGQLQLQPRENMRDDRVDALALATWGLPEFGDNDSASGSKKVAVSQQQKHPRVSENRHDHSGRTMRPRSIQERGQRQDQSSNTKMDRFRRRTRR